MLFAKTSGVAFERQSKKETLILQNKKASFFKNSFYLV